MAAEAATAACGARAPDIHADRILILDFGGQYTRLIARRVREAGVYCEILPYDADPARIERFGARGVILSGGPDSVVDPASVRAPPRIFELGVPVLGICYGMQTMAAQLGGRVEASGRREFGHAELHLSNPGALLDGIADEPAPGGGARLDVWMSHGDRVLEMPPGFRLMAATGNTPIAAIGDEARHFYGLQFHPEVTHTPRGREILDRFVHGICGCRALWSAQNIIEDAIAGIRSRTRGERVLLALSGGVDSSVVAALLHRAIGDRLTAIFVDTGLLRLHEGDQVMSAFARHLGVDVVRVDAGGRFFAALRGVSDPERKRKVIGTLFIEIFEEEAAKRRDGIGWLAQGTIYPDVIESAGAGSAKSHVIKSHHNVGGLPERMRLRLIEPLRELFKDEVRALGRALGLPREMVGRHPFPGPGLGVRILGEVNARYADTLRRADAIFIEELRRHDWYERVAQAFAVYLPVRSVGVMGDARRYEHVIALRAVETVDFMTARWAHLPYALLDTVSRRIINEVPGISRVTYDISGKPPATIEWE